MKNKDLHKDTDLKKIAPILFSLKKENLYKVPDGYFDELPTIIQDRIIDDILILPSVWAWFKNIVLKPQFAFGSISILILTLIGWLVFDNTEYHQAMLTSQDIAEVIYHQEIENLDEDVLIEAIPEENISNSANNQDLIIEYLIDNNIDENEIVNELNSI